VDRHGAAAECRVAAIAATASGPIDARTGRARDTRSSHRIGLGGTQITRQEKRFQAPTTAAGSSAGVILCAAATAPAGANANKMNAFRARWLGPGAGVVHVIWASGVINLCLRITDSAITVGDHPDFAARAVAAIAGRLAIDGCRAAAAATPWDAA
jgi:hypothetical protein